MTKYYNIYFHHSKRMTMPQILKSDTLNAGMLENAYDDLFVWHDIEHYDLHRVVHYIGLEFAPEGIEIYTSDEKYSPTEELICLLFYTEHDKGRN
jgi:hypothetical protein